MVVDARAGSPVDPARSAVGAVVGPVRDRRRAAPCARSRRWAAPSTATTSCAATSPRCSAQNSDLRSRLASDPLDRNRLAEYDGLVRTAKDTGYTLAPAHVVGIGPAQSFSRTVTLDAGTSSGIRPDSTVISKDGLVGRVLRATRSTSTVLLIVDGDSVVGGRLSATMKIGFVHGRDTPRQQRPASTSTWSTTRSRRGSATPC